MSEFKEAMKRCAEPDPRDIEITQLETENKRLREALENIHDIAVDYDGYRKAKSLMELIAGLRLEVQKALEE